MLPLVILLFCKNYFFLIFLKYYKLFLWLYFGAEGGISMACLQFFSSSISYPHLTLQPINSRPSFPPSSWHSSPYTRFAVFSLTILIIPFFKRLIRSFMDGSPFYSIRNSPPLSHHIFFLINFQSNSYLFGLLSMFRTHPYVT